MTKTATKPPTVKRPAKKAAAPLLEKALAGSTMSPATEALLTNPLRTITVGDAPELQHLPLDAVFPAVDNPRANLGDLTGLAASIAAVGVLEPVLVRVSPLVSSTSLTYQIVAGHRRLGAARLAGLDTIPCLVRTFTEQARVEAMVIENLQRQDLSPFDEARGLAQLVAVGLSQRDIAERVGCSQSHVSKRLALGALPAGVEGLFVTETMTIAQVEELARVPVVDIVPVLKELVKIADRDKAAPTLLPHWAIKQAIDDLKKQRKHAEAEKVGVDSGLKRLTDRPYDSPGGTHRVCKKADASHWYLHDREASILWARTQAAHNKATPQVERPPSEWELRRQAGERIEAFIVDTIIPAVTANELDRAVFVAEVTKLARQHLEANDRRGQSLRVQSLDYDLTELVGDDDALYLAIGMLFDLPSAIWDLPILEFFVRHGYRTTGEGETFPEGFDPTPILITDKDGAS